MMEFVIELLMAHNACSKSLIRRLSKYIFEKNLPKGHTELKAGEVCRYIYFVKKGLLRSYIIKGKKRQVNIWFMAENSMASAPGSFMQQTPAKEYIEAMEDTTVICLSREHYELLCNEFRAFQRMALNLLWHYHIMFYERTIDLLGLTNAEQYQYLIEKHPELKQRIAQKYWVSYMGMSNATFNRTVKKQQVRKPMDPHTTI
jgi:CRP-like cAMP-binding protein